MADVEVMSASLDQVEVRALNTILIFSWPKGEMRSSRRPLYSRGENAPVPRALFVKACRMAVAARRDRDPIAPALPKERQLSLF